MKEQLENSIKNVRIKIIKNSIAPCISRISESRIVELANEQNDIIEELKTNNSKYFEKFDSVAKGEWVIEAEKNFGSIIEELETLKKNN